MFLTYFEGVKKQCEAKKERDRIAEEIRLKEEADRKRTVEQEREKNERKIKRINELSSLGFVFDSNSYKCYENVIFVTQIEDSNDDEFSTFITQSKSVIEIAKQKEETQKKEKEKFAERINKVVALGLKFDFKENYTKDDFNVHITEIKADTDEEFNAKIEKISNEIKVREKKAADDKKILEEQLLRKEQENKELLEKSKQLESKAETVKIEKKLSVNVKKSASEKTKLLEFTKILESIEYPLLKTEEANIIMNDVKIQMSKIVNFIKSSTETL